MGVTMEEVRTLREQTGAGIMECKGALKECDGDLEKAKIALRQKGLDIASNKSSRTAKEGIIGSYIHSNTKIGVMVELCCETDFVARNEEFKTLAKDIAMQVAAANPLYLSKDDVPKEKIASESEAHANTLKGKPEHIQQKILDGKLEKFYSEVCLLEQPHIKDEDVKIKDYIISVVAKLKENIVLKKFIRYQVGEEA